MPGAEKICFVTGFQRSGTTVLTECLALAAGGPVLTVGDLARYMPPIAELLESLESRAVPLDRGLDPRLVSADLPEEYHHFLTWRSKLIPRQAYHSGAKADLQSLADAVAQRGGSETVVMKNPWDTTNEARLLNDFPGSSIVIIRRSLPEIEASMTAAMTRESATHDYIAAQLASVPLGRLADRIYTFFMRGPVRRRVAAAISVWQRRLLVLRLARSVHRLPAERTALLSYDEFKADPQAAAAWASHLVNPDVLAAEFAARSAPFGAGHQGIRGTRIAEAIDRYWLRSWDRARARQARD